MKTVCTPIAILLALSPFFAGCSPPVDSQTRMESAREHEARGDHVTAILELKNLLQTDADHVPALVRVGRLSLYAGQSAESIAFLERARTLGAPDEEVLEPLGRALLAQGHFQQVLDAIDPDSVAAVHRGRLHLLLAEAHLNLGDTEAARKAYMAAQQDASLVANALSGLADLERREGRYDSAQQLLDQALDDDPFSVVANRGVGALKIDQQRYEEAMDAFVRSIEATQIRPGSDELLLARVGMTETQWRMGQRNRALGNVKDLLNAYPWHPLPRYLRALLAYDSGEYELAGEYLREVLEIVPRHFPSTRLLAAVEFELENYANVELLLRDYLVTFPNDIEMRRLSAATHLRMGNAARAMAVLMPALEQGFDDNRFLTLLGRASLHSGDPETAAAYLTRAMSLDPTNQQTLVSLIFALITTGEITRAEAALRRIPDTRKTEETRQLLHLVMLMQQDENERASQFARDLRQITPSSLHAMLALAELAETRGDPDRAMDWLEMARSRNPDAVEPRLLLVRYYHGRGNHQKAHAIATEAVQIRPHQADALIALGQEKLDLGQADTARSLFDEALQASPESGDAMLGMAFAAARDGEIDYASEYLAAAVSADPALMPRAVRLVLELADASKPDHALELATSLQQAGADLPDGYTAAGDVHMAQRQFDQALAQYEAAMQFSDDPVIAVKSFIAAREAGLDQPTAVLQRWLARHPNDSRVRRILESAERS